MTVQDEGIYAISFFAKAFRPELLDYESVAFQFMVNDWPVGDLFQAEAQRLFTSLLVPLPRTTIVKAHMRTVLRLQAGDEVSVRLRGSDSSFFDFMAYAGVETDIEDLGSSLCLYKIADLP